MKKVKWIMLAGVMLLFAGCEVVQMSGDPNGPVTVDPNTAIQIISIGEALQAIGVAIGHIELIGIGLGVVAIGAFLLKKKKPD